MTTHGFKNNYPWVSHVSEMMKVLLPNYHQAFRPSRHEKLSYKCASLVNILLALFSAQFNAPHGLKLEPENEANGIRGLR